MVSKTKRIAPVGLAPVGLAITINGQRFDLVAHAPLTKRDGSIVPAMVWHAECATCGEGFTCQSVEGRFAEVRRCELHRQPGTPVRQAQTSADHSDQITPGDLAGIEGTAS